MGKVFRILTSVCDAESVHAIHCRVESPHCAYGCGILFSGNLVDGKIMTNLDFKPRGVCARMIHVELSDDGSTIKSVSFEGGCNGNLKAIGKLVAGQSVDMIVDLLKGNTCGPRSTSCADQLTIALREAQAQARA